MSKPEDDFDRLLKWVIIVSAVVAAFYIVVIVIETIRFYRRTHG